MTFDITAKRFEGDFDYLSSLHKRVSALADQNAVPDVNNKLWVLWSNMKHMLDKNQGVEYNIDVMYFTAVMAKEIDIYSQTHMLTGDSTVAKILFELDDIKIAKYELVDWHHHPKG